MLKRFFAGAFLTLVFVGGAQTVQALSLDDGSLTGAAGVAQYDTGRQLEDTIGLLIKAVIAVLGVVFLVLTVYAGLTWMTAAGDAKKIEKAKGILTSSVIGLVICLSAYSITVFVVNQLEGI